MGVIAVPFFIGEPIADLDVPRPHVLLQPPLPAAPPMQRMASLYEQLAGLVETTPDPVVYAGDCLAIMGVIGGLQRRGIEPTMVFFDAHGDFHTWDTTQSDFLGGMPLAMATGRGEQTITSGIGMRTVLDNSTWLVDGRDLDPGEDTAIAESGIHHVSVEQVGAEPPMGDLYVHIDVDVVDPSKMPAVNYPAPGGPSVEAVAAAAKALHRTGRVVAFSFSTWNPALEGADIAAAACRGIAEPFL